MTTLDDAKKMGESIRSKNKSLRNIEIKVRNSPTEVWGEGLSDTLKNMKGGFYPHKNMIIVFSDNHESLDELEKTFKHEILGHLGLKMIGEEKKSFILDNILSAKEDSYTGSMLKRVEKAYSHIEDPRIIAEETFSKIAEEASPYISVNNPTTHVKGLDSKEDVLAVVDLIKRDMHYGYLKPEKVPFFSKDKETLYARFGNSTDEEVVVAAEASKSVYDKKSKQTDLLTPISEDELRFYKVTNFENPKIGFRSSFNFDNQGNILMAFKGTSGIKDWIYGNPQGLGAHSAQYKAAAKLAREAGIAFGSNLRITGHSLGGGLATLASAITGAPTITFNSAGLHPNSLLVNQLDYSDFSKYAEKGRVTRCIVKGEILNLLQDRTFLPNSLGLRVDMEHPRNPNALTKHSMDSVEESIFHEIQANALRTAILENNTQVIPSLVRTEQNSEVLRMLKGNTEPFIVLELAQNRNTPLDLLLDFSKGADPLVRAATAKNPSLPDEVVWAMRKDKDKMVQKVADEVFYGGRNDSSVRVYTSAEKESFIEEVTKSNERARNVAKNPEKIDNNINLS